MPVGFLRIILLVLTLVLVANTYLVWTRPDVLWTDVTIMNMNDFLMASGFALLNLWNLFVMVQFKLPSVPAA